jgi:hypothetical protein
MRSGPFFLFAPLPEDRRMRADAHAKIERLTSKEGFR